MADTVFVVNTGLDIVTNRLLGNGTEPNYVSWGTGTTTATAADSDLETESAESRTSGTSSQQTTNTANDTYRVVGTITSLSDQSITEVGLFDASSGGNLFVRATFSAISVNLADSIEFIINVSFDQDS